MSILLILVPIYGDVYGMVEVNSTKAIIKTLLKLMLYKLNFMLNLLCNKLVEKTYNFFMCFFNLLYFKNWLIKKLAVIFPLPTGPAIESY